MTLLHDIHCLQLDPLNVVARTQLLVLWSRLGPYRVADLEALLYDDKRLFEYWAHAASIVVTDNYPLHFYQLQHFLMGSGKWQTRVREWLIANEGFRQYVKAELATRGPLGPTEMDDLAVEPWKSTGWTSGRNVDRMLGFLWEMGELMVARRSGSGFGLQKKWALTEDHLPEWQAHVPLAAREVTRRAVPMSLRALGVGTKMHIKRHFMRGWYPELESVLAELVQAGDIEEVTVMDGERPLPNKLYIHRDDLPLLAELSNGGWQPRPVLLSPFDNLICDRDRAELLIGLYYRSEIYTPKAKRKYGYYVMPLLAGDKLVGRIDPKMDRKTGKLHVNAVHWEPQTRVTKKLERELERTIGSLATFLQADEIVYEAHKNG